MTEPRDIEKDKAFLSHYPDTVELINIPLYWIAQYEAVQKAGRAIVESYERITNDMEDEYKAAQARITELENNNKLFWRNRNERD